MTIPDNFDRPGARIPCETRNVFGFSVAVSSVEEMSAALAERALEAEAPFLVAAADAHVVTLGVHDRDYGNVLERMDVICPDGMPVVWRLNRGAFFRGKGSVPRERAGFDGSAGAFECAVSGLAPFFAGRG